MLIDFEVEGGARGLVSYSAQWLSVRIAGVISVLCKNVLPNEIAMTVMVIKLTDLMMPAEYRASN